MRVKKIQQVDDSCIAFFPDSLRFFEVNKETMDIINSIIDGRNFKEVSSEFDFFALFALVLLNVIKMIIKTRRKDAI